MVTNRKGAFGTQPLYRLRVVTGAGLELFAQQVGFIDSKRNALVTQARARAWEFNDVIPNQAALLAATYAGPGRGSGPMRGPRGANRGRA